MLKKFIKFIVCITNMIIQASGHFKWDGSPFIMSWELHEVADVGEAGCRMGGVRTW